MRPSWAQRLPWDAIAHGAQKLSLEPVLLAAVIQHESRGCTWKTRLEPGYEWVTKNPEVFAVRLSVSVETEVMQQKMSWGLMQLMGATAREEGFLGYFPELCADVDVGIFYGAQYLKRRMSNTRTLDEALATYNGGPGAVRDGTIVKPKCAVYAASVMALYRELAG